MRIYKYPIQITDVQDVFMPVGAQILSAQLQSDFVTLWAKVDENAREVNRRIAIYGTGHPIPDEHVGEFIGTVQQAGFVWHVFELK